MQIFRARMCVLLKNSIFFQKNVSITLYTSNSKFQTYFGIVLVHDFVWIFHVKYSSRRLKLLSLILMVRCITSEEWCDV